ncbi:hypothetical protein AVEN_75646-1 [Araneus ventricosus]|uniref:Uncharacterized protein n=1 Tax=Araneus ventricosus TaxID=182803 RepID=A0A4Y2D6T9_ARAVE|nr:hypothetical protein AVEN_75646-1 [Araneus ventricosus]
MFHLLITLFQNKCQHSHAPRSNDSIVCSIIKTGAASLAVPLPEREASIPVAILDVPAADGSHVTGTVDTCDVNGTVGKRSVKRGLRAVPTPIRPTPLFKNCLFRYNDEKTNKNWGLSLKRLAKEGNKWI